MKHCHSLLRAQGNPCYHGRVCLGLSCTTATGWLPQTSHTPLKESSTLTTSWGHSWEVNLLLVPGSEFRSDRVDWQEFTFSPKHFSICGFSEWYNLETPRWGLGSSPRERRSGLAIEMVWSCQMCSLSEEISGLWISESPFHLSKV